MSDSIKIPLGKPLLHKGAILEEISKVLDSGWISGGPTIGKFEEAVKAFNQDSASHYVAVSDGTCAIEISLMYLNGGKRYSLEDEVIVPSWSWVATAFAPVMAGATPVWCDVNEYGVMTAELIEPLITDKTKVIIVVHQMGIPCDMDSINALAKKYHLAIIEDAACAFGSEYKGKKIGVSKNLVTYSFQARKCLTTGEGGMIVTHHPAVADWLRSYRAFGTSVSPLERDRSTKLLKESFNTVSSNYKISDITAAVGIAQLTVYNQEVELRNIVANQYRDLLFPHTIGNDPYLTFANVIPSYCTAYNWQNYHILINPKFDRDEVIRRLRKLGIGCKWDIQAIHLEPVFKGNYEHIKLPSTMTFHNHGLWLPFYAELTTSDQLEIVQSLLSILQTMDHELHTM